MRFAVNVQKSVFFRTFVGSLELWKKDYRQLAFGWGLVFSQGLSEFSSQDELGIFSVTKSVTYSIRDVVLKTAKFKTKLTKG